MCSRRLRIRSPYSGTSWGSAPSAATTTWRRAHRPARRAQRALARRRDRARDRRALADARARPLGRARERADPARRLQRAVVIGQAREAADAADGRRQVVALDDLGREAVLAQRLGVAQDVERLLLGGRQAQAADAPHRLARAELLGQRVELLLGGERVGVEAAGRGAPVALARVDVEGRRAREQEPAVAAAGARRDGAALEQQGAQAVARQPPGARQPADAAADDADVDLGVRVERGAGLVGACRARTASSLAFPMARSVRLPR